MSHLTLKTFHLENMKRVGDTPLTGCKSFLVNDCHSDASPANTYDSVCIVYSTKQEPVNEISIHAVFAQVYGHLRYRYMKYDCFLEEVHEES